MAPLTVCAFLLGLALLGFYLLMVQAGHPLTVGLSALARQHIKRGEFSDVSCIADFAVAGSEDTISLSGSHGRMCAFTQVCFNENDELQFYSDPSLPPEPLFVRDGIYVDFPREFINLRRYEMTWHRWYSPKLLRASIPSHAVWSAAAVHVLYHQFWPENFGHVLGDDVYAAWQILYRFGLVTRDLQVLGWKPCWYSGQENDSDGKRACRVTHELFGFLSDRRWQQLKDFIGAHLSNNDVGQPRLVCMDRLVMGHGLQGMYWQGANWPLFIEHILPGLSAQAVETKPSRPRILVTRKVNRRKIINLDVVVEHLRATFDVDVDVWEPDSFSFEEQVQRVRQYPVLITPCGGVSFISPFMYPGSSVIYIDYFNPHNNQTEFMEEFLWQFDGRLNRYHYYIAREDVIDFDADAKSKRGDQRNITMWEWWRNFPIHHVVPERMAYFAFQALRKASRRIGLADTIDYVAAQRKNNHFQNITLRSFSPSQYKPQW